MHAHMSKQMTSLLQGDAELDIDMAYALPDEKEIKAKFGMRLLEQYVDVLSSRTAFLSKATCFSPQHKNQAYGCCCLSWGAVVVLGSSVQLHYRGGPLRRPRAPQRFSTSFLGPLNSPLQLLQLTARLGNSCGLKF